MYRMKGQMAIEFFFAMALVYLAVAWLVNYMNVGYGSGKFLALRQERLIAADIATIADKAYVSNTSATLSAPCMVLLGKAISYRLGSSENGITVSSDAAAQTASASTLCPITANITTYNTVTGVFDDVLISCNPKNGVDGTTICIRPDGDGNVGMSLGRCTA
ncbi:MAG: hypothetical protein WC408_00280 [Candidatus Micrarchaeia archaeon]